ncbi:hypothetical protein MGI18_09485 [Bacillus sp. OVS6]|nr:hypothetical protein MGI18_09485 [Bacillus sp. OVS6]
MVQNGEFREDLFYRLNVVPILIPSLRDRKSDILPLTELFWKKPTKGMRRRNGWIRLLKIFYTYSWPGNVRELANLIERLVLISEEDLLKTRHLPSEYKRQEGPIHISKIVTLKEAAELAEEKILSLAVKKYKTTYEIAEALDSSQPTIVRKMKKYGLCFEQPVQ